MKNIFTKITVGAVTSAVSIAIVFDVSRAEAASLSILNSGFEQPALDDGGYTFREQISGWEIYDPSNLFADENSNYAVLNPTTASYPGAPEGNNIGAIFLNNAPGSGIAGFSQTLTDVLTSGKVYNLAVEIGNPLPDDYTGPGFPGYAVQLLAGSQVIAEDFNTLLLNEGTFVTSTLSYTALANDPNLGGALSIRLLNVLDSGGKEVGFDNVRLEASSVPEFTSVLSLLGLSALFGGSAFKKKLASSQQPTVGNRS